MGTYMLSKSIIAGHIKEMILNSLKIPLVYAIFGVIFLGLSYADDVFKITKWPHFFSVMDEVGLIFLTLAGLTFFYNIIVYIFDLYRERYQQDFPVIALIFSNLIIGARIIFALIFINILVYIIGLNDFYLNLADEIVNVIMIGAVGWIALQILSISEAGLYQYMLSLTASDHLRVKALYTKIRIIRNIGTVVIIVLTIAAILMSFNSVRNIGISLLASAGFLTAILGLSAQKTLISLFSGLQIALSQPIKIGDVVVIEGNSGIIEEITFTYVTLKLGDRKRLMVPIYYFVEKPFENWSREGENLRSSFIMHVDYNHPIQPLRDELNRILNESKYWDKKASKLQVADIAENTVQIRIQVSAANADDLSDLRAEVKEKLLDFVRTNYPEHFPKKH